VYTHLERISGSYYAFFSFDGAGWIQLTPAIPAISATIGVIMIDMNSGGAAAIATMAVDWLRVNWLTIV